MGRLANRDRRASRPSSPAIPPDRPGPGGWRRALLALALSAAALVAPAAAQAATPPQVTSTSVSGVSETAATLQGKIDSGAKKTEYRFEYITAAAYLADNESFGEGAVSIPSPEGTIPGHPKATGDLTAGKPVVTSLEVIEGALEVGQAVTPIPGVIPAGTTIVALGKGTLTLSQPAEANKAGATLTTTGPQPISAQATGLSPGTSYRVRIAAHHGAEATVFGEAISFATLAPPPLFGPCPNDLFRTGGAGVLLPPGDPSASLPDCRAYEQVSPVEKDGADAVGDWNALAASPDGQAATFLSSFGMPGGEGAQTIPTFLGSRSASGWSSAGLLPPTAVGNVARLIGWTPDFALSLSEAVRYSPTGGPREAALFLREGTDPPRRITPYESIEGSDAGVYSYAGASADEAELLFEAHPALPPEEGAEPLPGAIEGSPHVYAYDTDTGTLALAAQMNSANQSEELLPHGAFAGPYEWGRGSGSFQLNHGGGAYPAKSFLLDTHAVSAAGDLFFTAAGTGQLYERVNPTQPQSPLNGAGECEDPETMACTYHLSATHKTNGLPSGTGPDPAGPAPAAFMAGSEDGSVAYFTSPEKLTDDANTGPEVSPAQVGTAKLEGEEPATEVEPSFLPSHALGMATSTDGHYLYWADPVHGSIGRADLTAPDPKATVEAEFIVPEETEAENFPEKEPGVLHSAPTAPRYVAVGPCAEEGHILEEVECLYWTNTGPLGSRDKNPAGLEPVLGAGSIGRAELDASGDLVPESVNGEFIAGKVDNGSGPEPAVSDPQGIAVSASHIYWANADARDGVYRKIGRATIEGEEVEPRFWDAGNNGSRPFGLAIGSGHLYFADFDALNNTGIIVRIALEGGEEEDIALGEAVPRGVAVDATHVYWVDREKAAIGRAGLGEFEPGFCETTILGCDKKFIELEGSPEGVAIDPTGHLYWSTNGESPTNPGTDLYRFRRPGAGGCEEAIGCLDDLSADPAGDGGEALGVLGASTDGSYLYFAANGVLAGNEGARGSLATPGDCRGGRPHEGLANLSGHCNLYLYHAGDLRFIARLDAAGGVSVGGHSDARDWVPGANSLEGGDSSPNSPRLASVSPGGRTLLFRSQESLTPYAAGGVPEYYRYDAATGKIACLTCNPTGAPPQAAPTLFTSSLPTGLALPGIGAPALIAHNLADEGHRFFFQSTEALLGSDIDAGGGCPDYQLVGTHSQLPACQDVYEWEAPDAGTCSAASTSYSAQDEGCIYLLSPGNDARPALFAAADESGDNAFLFSRDQLVGQDQDQLFDLYDARAVGGLASQNPLPKEPCGSGEACKPQAAPPPATSSPATRGFQGPGNVKPKPSKCPRGKRPAKHKGHVRCVKKPAHGHKRHHRKGGRR